MNKMYKITSTNLKGLIKRVTIIHQYVIHVYDVLGKPMSMGILGTKYDYIQNFIFWRNLAHGDNGTTYYIQTIILKSRIEVNLDKRPSRNNYANERVCCAVETCTLHKKLFGSLKKLGWDDANSNHINCFKEQRRQIINSHENISQKTQYAYPRHATKMCLQQRIQ